MTFIKSLIILFTKVYKNENVFKKVWLVEVDADTLKEIKTKPVRLLIFRLWITNNF